MDETAILALAPSPDVFDAGARLAHAGALSELRRTADASYLWAHCAGSGAEPYAVAADLAGAAPRLTCTCPSRKRPCKHALALLVQFTRSAATFSEAPPPEDLAQKRAKASAPPAEKKPKKERAPNKAAEAKKAQAQLEGLAIAERVLADLATSGLGTLDAPRLSALSDRARELADFYLPGLAVALRRLALLLSAEGDVDAKSARAARQVAQLWTMARKGRSLLEHKLEEEPASAAESDAVLEELLGKVWQLSELKDKGFVRERLELVELGYARVDDAARDERVETSYLLDLERGEVLRDVAYVPTRRIGKEPPKSSYAFVEVREAAVYPGFLNPRVRWEKGDAQERALTAEDCARAIARARPIADALAKFQAQAKNLLAPDSAVVLVQAARAGKVGGVLVLEDGAGRLQLDASPERGGALRTLERVGWPSGCAAALVELSLHPLRPQVLAFPMALLAPTGLVRLSH